jgi:hypothetical protein
MKVTDLINIPAGINQGVSPAHQITMLSLLGNPRSSFDQTCRPVTNPALAALVQTDNVGPFRVTGLSPAVQSLKEVLAEVRSDAPAVFEALGTAGMLCARNVRGSTTSISNHSWGTAIDLTLDGQLDTPGNGTVQAGMAQIAPIFNRHGWFWGAAFPREDGMHFELSDETIRRLHASGIFGGPARTQPPTALSLGDSGPEVTKLQTKLKAAGEDIDVDGAFGRNTMAAVMDFQSKNGLTADGIAGPKTLKALGI